MKCKRNIPCPMGGMNCCMECELTCDTRCEYIRKCRWEMIGNTMESAGRILWKVIILILLFLILARFDHLEKEHNAIIDRLDQVENTITEQINGKFPSEGFTDTEENLGGSFKSWMSFQVNNG